MPKRLPTEPDQLALSVLDDLVTLAEAEGLSLAELGRRAGASTEYVSHTRRRVAAGRASLSLNMVSALADVLGLNVTVILSKKEHDDVRRGLINMKDAAAIAGVNVGTFNKWLDEGLIEPAPSPGHFRRFDPEQVGRDAARIKATWTNKQQLNATRRRKSSP